MPMKKTLLVLVPGYRGDPSSLRPLHDAIIAEGVLSDSESLDFYYPEPIWSNRDLETVAQKLADEIDSRIHDDSQNIERIILLGHSMGSLVLRRAFINAIGCGSTPGIAQTWAARVERIILIGAFGRGLDLSKIRNKRQRRQLKFLYAVSRLFRIGGMRWQVLAGSDFVSRLRVDWIFFNRSSSQKPIVVHLLGSNDEYIRREDVIDLEQFPHAISIGIPDATHADVILPKRTSLGQLKRAFVETPSDAPAVIEMAEAKKVFFLLHGIRDSRDCFHRVAKQLKHRCPDAKIVVPDYGYLSARSFVSSAARNRFVPWFVDQYSELMASNPGAEFYFAGHSNGTYILGESLRRIPRLRFDHVYLAASVLPAEYDWNDVVKKHRQTEFLRSDMGTEDWPVGVLCRVLNRWGMRSIGPGGFDGFQYGDQDHIAHYRFTGGHGSMLTGLNVKSIADYLLTGNVMADEGSAEEVSDGAFSIFKKYGDVLIPLIALAMVALFIFLVAAHWLWPGTIVATVGPISAFALLITGWIVAGRF